MPLLIVEPAKECRLHLLAGSAVAVLHNHEDIHRGYGEEVQEALLRWLYEQ